MKYFFKRVVVFFVLSISLGVAMPDSQYAPGLDIYNLSDQEIISFLDNTDIDDLLATPFPKDSSLPVKIEEKEDYFPENNANESLLPPGPFDILLDEIEKKDSQPLGKRGSYPHSAKPSMKRVKYPAVFKVSDVAYWRIHPSEDGKFQLCNHQGQPLYSRSIRVPSGNPRVLRDGRLRFFHKKKEYRFPRCPDDHKDLTKNGFVLPSGKKLQLY